MFAGEGEKLQLPGAREPEQAWRLCSVSANRRQSHTCHDQMPGRAGFIAPYE